ncbi:MAG: hypothetical protein AB1768_20140 [Pseudomonadota bacterium]|jgi:hypothetical protein
MTLSPLDNLVKIGQLKAEPRNEAEVRWLLAMARTRLDDAELGSLSLEGRFISAYNAAHAAALAALRWHGYRSKNRYTVFQCLAHTLDWPAARWRVLDNAHQKRNMAESMRAISKSTQPRSKNCAASRAISSRMRKIC